jgi:hypothetical protein
MKMQDGDKNIRVFLGNSQENSNSLKYLLESLLQSIYKDHQEGNKISSLKKYVDNTPLGYSWMRKIVKVGIIERVNDGRKYLEYTWAKGNNPRYDELVRLLLTTPKVGNQGGLEFKKTSRSLNTDDIIEITLILKRHNLTESEVKQITKEIQLYFQTK